MKKTIVGIIFFLSGFVSVLLIRLSSIKNPLTSWSGSSYFEAYLEKFNLESFYQLSSRLIVVGVILLLIEPVLIIYKYIKENMKIEDWFLNSLGTSTSR